MAKLAYCVAEAAGLLSISRSKLYEMIKAGLVPVHKIGRRTLILHDDLVAIFKLGNTAAPPSGA